MEVEAEALIKEEATVVIVDPTLLGANEEVLDKE